MEEKDCKLDKSKVALKKEKRGKKSKSSNTYSNETKSNTENDMHLLKDILSKLVSGYRHHTI